MEVLRASAVGVAVALGHSIALADEAASSVASFPDTAPAQSSPGSGAPSRAGFPAPVPAPSSSVSRAPVPPVAYPSYPPATSPATRAPQQYYGAPTAGSPPGGYYVAPSYQPGAPYGGSGSGYYGPAVTDHKEEENKEKPTRYVSLTLSPVHLALPVLEGTFEAKPVDHLGIAVVGGIGNAPPVIVGQTLVEGGERFAVREIGAQLLVYPIGKFDGLVLGGEVLSVKVSGTISEQSGLLAPQTFDVTASALALGPLIGGKWIHESGFTLFGHVGAQRLWLNAETNALGKAVSQSDARWFPLVNLNAGWSF